MVKCKAEWYHADMSSQTASQVCSVVGRNGAFLVRKSGTIVNAFVVSLFVDDEVYHHVITRRAHDVFCLEATKRCFPSIDELVYYYRNKRESFMHPLLMPITKATIKQFPRGWKQIAITQSIYDRRHHPSHHSSSSETSTELQHDQLRPLPSTPETLEKKEEEEDLPWPEPPPPVAIPEPSNETRTVVQPGHHATISRSHSTAWDSFANYGPQSNFTQTLPARRRTLSLEEVRKYQTGEHDDKAKRQTFFSQTCRLPSMSQNFNKQEMTTKKDSKSPIANFAQLFHKKMPKARQSIVTAFKQPESTVATKLEEDFEDVENEHCIPIICKTAFVTTTDSDGEPGAMFYKTGTEMMVKGVRIDGWWYCLNKTTQQKGWVLQNNLQPKSDPEWFEAKVVETPKDREIYHKIDHNSAEFDVNSDDDDNYCRYLMPNNQ